MCDVCAPVYGLIRKCVECQENGTSFQLTKGDVFHHLLFPMAWNSRQCLCCFKQTKNYEAYNNIIQMICNIGIGILQNFDDESKVIRNPNANTEIADDSGILASEASWTLQELEQLLNFLTSSFQMSFPLYLVCKHNHIWGVEELPKPELAILASYCDISEAESMPVMLLRNVCFFCDSGGPNAIRNVFECFSDILTMPITSSLILTLSNLRSWLNSHAIETHLFPVKSCLVRYMCSLSDDALRHAATCNIIENIQAVIRDDNCNNLVFDEETLLLALKYFKCSTLTIRMAGIQQLNSQVGMFNEALSHGAEDLETTAMILAQWFVTNKILEHLFGPNLHTEIVKHSQPILNFLATEGKITSEHLDLIWSAAQQKHCGRQAQDVLILLIKHLKLNNLVYLTDLLFKLEPSQHTSLTVQMAYHIYRSFLSIPGRLQRMSSQHSMRDLGPDDGVSTSAPSEGSESSDSESELSQLQAISISLPRPPNKPSNDWLGAPKHRVVSPCSGMDDSEESESTGSPPRPSRRSPQSLSIDPIQQAVMRCVVRDGKPDLEPIIPMMVEELNQNLIKHLADQRRTSPLSQMSLKSDKDMADFMDEDTASDEELTQIVQTAAECRENIASLSNIVLPTDCSGNIRPDPAGIVHWPVSPNADLVDSGSEGAALDLCNIKYINIETICDKGHCLLWDLIQDDMARDLTEGLLPEIEKYLSSIIMLPDILIKMKNKFAQACLENLANNRSETQSLRLLVKIFSSMRYSDKAIVMSMPLMFDTSMNMMNVFFSNLINFSRRLSQSDDSCAYKSILGLNVDISVRLSFLTYIYSNSASANSFCLSRKHMDTLWDCMATNKVTCDYLLSWLHTQVKNRDCHALNAHMFKHIYQHKLTQLDQRRMSMTGFSLFKFLHEMLSHTSLISEPDADLQIWNVALKCDNSDVSLSAIDYLNNCYTSSDTLEREPEFVNRCMKCVMTALSNVELEPDISIQIIERGLFLLKNHIQIFKQKHSFHIRLYEISQVVGGSLTHCNEVTVENPGPSKRISLNLNASSLKNVEASARECKVTIDLAAETLLGQLRAEVSDWWAHHVIPTAGSTERITDPSLSANLRLIYNGHELTQEHDHKSLLQLQVKDGQTIHVSLSSNRKPKGYVSFLNSDVYDLLPMRVLLQDPHFDNLLTTLETLHSLNQKLPGADKVLLCNRAKVLSRHVWDLLMLLPTKMSIAIPLLNILPQPTNGTNRSLPEASANSKPPTPNKAPPTPEETPPTPEETPTAHNEALPGEATPTSEGAPPISEDTPPTIGADVPAVAVTDSSAAGADSLIDFGSVLSVDSLPRLVYSLQIVEMLTKRRGGDESKLTISSGGGQKVYKRSDEIGMDPQQWSIQFVRTGGLDYLFKILLSNKLQAENRQRWDEWKQECLAYLLRLICNLSVIELPNDNTTPPESSTKKKDEASTSHCDITTNSSSQPIKEHAENQPYRRRSLSKGSSGRRVSESKQPLYSDNKEARFVKPATPLAADRKVEELRTTEMFNQVMTRLLDNKKMLVFKALVSLLDDSVHFHKSLSTNWARLEIVKHSMSYLVHWAYSDATLCDTLVSMSDPSYSRLLETITLSAPEADLRHEACWSVYLLCASIPSEASRPAASHPYLLVTLTALLELLPFCVNMKPVLNDLQDIGEERKQSLGPSSHDYLWLLAQLLDRSDSQPVADKVASDLCGYLSSRPFYELRHSSAEDEGLIGLLNIATVTLKNSSTFKSSNEAKLLLENVFGFLFNLPSVTQRHLPKCKSNKSRMAAYDLLTELVRGSVQNYLLLHSRLMSQHTQNSIYQWDYWPNEDVRSSSGFVGLQNLGATCYMATCMQQLFMIPEARQSILQAKMGEIQSMYSDTLGELQKMFAYLMESERKSFNPHGFCKVYEMDHRPLNTGEQKDMTEFFTDLITKLEDMSPQLKGLVKSLFGGVLSNNVVSLDCSHVSRTLEEFYTIRCPVSGMKSLFESLDDVCVKDTLDGDNMYTCSQCQRKVRAEKRACFKRLPHIFCFNTMRYTFNMVTMTKEKVNTHFSFPQQLSMKDYMESHLLGTSSSNEGSESDAASEGTDYELIGVTVHTGTADGGHYYSFIRDRVSRETGKPDKWFLFNDAEVKLFDPALIAQECFGGELTSKTYDNIADRFMDFAFEKTNSAYMLFYERISPANAKSNKPPVPCPTPMPSTSAESSNQRHDQPATEPMDLKSPSNQPVNAESETQVSEEKKYNFELSGELAEWIWKDNTSFLRDKNIFCHNYFGFMMQICSTVPCTLSDLSSDGTDVNLYATQLTTSFLMETFIHAKEKPTMVQWIELLTKQFSQSHEACEWFLDVMARNAHWPRQILLGCPLQMIRQMFQRLTFHVITQCLKHTPDKSYKDPSRSGVARFVLMLLKLLDSTANPDIKSIHYKYLTEYFCLLVEFARQGQAEKDFLVANGSIRLLVTFYTQREPSSAKKSSSATNSDDDLDDEGLAMISDERSRLFCLDKMGHLIALLTEGCRGDPSGPLILSDDDHDALTNLRFLSSLIREGINTQHTCNLIFSLCRWNFDLADNLVEAMLIAIVKSNSSMHVTMILKVLTLLVELQAHPPGLPNFMQLVLSRFWEACEKRAGPLLEWMANTVGTCKMAREACLYTLEHWMEKYLIINPHVKTRMCALFLLNMLVPCNTYHTLFRTRYPPRQLYSEKNFRQQMSPRAVEVLHKIYKHLLDLMPTLGPYTDIAKYGSQQLVSYFTAIALCLVSAEEKLMFTPYFKYLWPLFQPKISEPQISVNNNKQALLIFWYQATADCPENIRLITGNEIVTKNISFNYILADHEDQEVVVYNREMLARYYGILRVCCERSRQFTRSLANQQNVHWAFQHILPVPHLYPDAAEELLSMLELFVAVYRDTVPEELEAVQNFKRKTFLMMINALNVKVEWHSILVMMKVLISTDEDRLMFLSLNAIHFITDIFIVLHTLYHEANTSHLLTELADCLSIFEGLLKVATQHWNSPEREKLMKSAAASASTSDSGASRQSTIKSLNNSLTQWKSKEGVAQHCLLLLNSYFPSEIRIFAIDIVKSIIKLFPKEIIPQLASWLLSRHVNFQSSESMNFALQGPHMPTRFSTAVNTKINVRPPQPHFGMFIHSTDLHRGQEPAYDQALLEYFVPYHLLIDLMVRVAANSDCLNETVVNLSALVGYEGIAIHSAYFPKLWCEIYNSEKTEKTSNYIKMLLSVQYLVDYVEVVLHNDTSSLNNVHIYNFMSIFLPLVHKHVVEDNPEGFSIIKTLTQRLKKIIAVGSGQSHPGILWHVINKTNGDLRALSIVLKCQSLASIDDATIESLRTIRKLCELFKATAKPQILASGSPLTPKVTQPELEAHGSDTTLGSTPNKRRKKDPDDSDASEVNHGASTSAANVKAPTETSLKPEGADSPTSSKASEASTSHTGAQASSSATAQLSVRLQKKVEFTEGVLETISNIIETLADVPIE